MRRNFERVRVKNASSEKEKCSPMEDDDDDNVAGPSLVGVQWVQVHLQILKRTDFAPTDF